MDKESVKQGDILYCPHGTDRWLVKVDTLDGNYLTHHSCLNLNARTLIQKEARQNAGWGYIQEGTRFATPIEIQWFEMCMKEDKVLPMLKELTYQIY